MTEDEIGAWQRRLEDTFAGPSGTVGERILNLRNREAEIGVHLVSQFRGYVALMDSFFDFYIETLRHTVGVCSTQGPAVGPAIVAILVPTLWRFRSSYLLFWNGYSVDAMSLLRAVWENVLLVAGLRHGIIGVDDVFGKLTVGTSDGLSDEEIRRRIRKHTRECDRKLADHFTGSESGLSASSAQSLSSMLRTLHSAVHRCKLNVVLLYGPFVRGGRPIPIFPRYDEDLASSYMNISQSLGWMLARVLPLLQTQEGSFPDRWQRKRLVLDDSFRQAIAASDKLLARAVEELVERRFVFTRSATVSTRTQEGGEERKDPSHGPDACLNNRTGTEVP